MIYVYIYIYIHIYIYYIENEDLPQNHHKSSFSDRDPIFLGDWEMQRTRIGPTFFSNRHAENEPISKSISTKNTKQICVWPFRRFQTPVLATVGYIECPRSSLGDFWWSKRGALGTGACPMAISSSRT